MGSAGPQAGNPEGNVPQGVNPQAGVPQAGNQQPASPVEQFVDEHGNYMLRFPDGSVCPADVNNGLGVGITHHRQNLAEVLNYAVLQEIGASLKEAIEDDIESQSKYFASVTEIVEQLGINTTSDGDIAMPFDGASNIRSMAVYDSLLHLSALVSQHLYPAENMVETRVVGVSSEQTTNIANRKKIFLNFFLTKVAKEFRKESIRTCLWAALSGSAYKKVYIDPVLGRPVSRFIPIDDFIVNRSHSSHHAARRKTHILRLSDRDLQVRRAQRIYRDIPVLPTEGDDFGDDELQELRDEIQGYERVYNRHDKEYQIYESHVELKIKEDPQSHNRQLGLPYIVSMDAKSGVILSIYRNWEEGDPTTQAEEYFVNFSLFPSLDGEGYGLSSYASRLSKAATMMTRQLINAGLYANFPGGIMAAGIRLEDNKIMPAPAEWVRVQTAGLGVKDAFQPLPYGEPSPTLLQLRNEVEDAIKKPCMIVNDKMLDIAPRAPAGTVLFMLEQMHKVPTALMQNFYQSFDEELDLLDRRLREWLQPGQPYPFSVNGGDHVIMKDDFNPNIKVYPSSDPSLPNSAYRLLQSELIVQTADKYPQLHNQRAILKYYYENLGLGTEDIDSFLLPPPQDNPPIPLNPVSENGLLLTGKPVVTGMDQDDESHIIVHTDLFTHPDPNVVAAAHAHVKEHEANRFAKKIFTQMNMPVPQDPSQIPPEIQNQIAFMAAKIVEQEQLQKNGGQAPLTMEQVKMAEIAAGKEKSQLEAQVKMMDIEQQREKMRLDMQMEEAALREKESASLMRLRLEEMQFNHEKALKEVELRMKEREIELKANEDMRKHDMHVHAMNQPPKEATKET